MLLMGYKQPIILHLFYNGNAIIHTTFLCKILLSFCKKKCFGTKHRMTLLLLKNTTIKRKPHPESWSRQT